MGGQTGGPRAFTAHRGGRQPKVSADSRRMLCITHRRGRVGPWRWSTATTRRLHQDGTSYGKGFDKQAIMRLNRIKAAVDQRDLSAFQGNRFEKLKGDRAGTYSIRINEQWRITFRIENNRALDVTIEDYH